MTEIMVVMHLFEYVGVLERQRDSPHFLSILRYILESIL
jgi:hypothetical protein